jgi:methionyl-tRNA synthetase
MILRYQEGVIGEISEAEHDAAMYHQAMNNFEFDKALDVVWGMVHGINIYIEDQKPWQIAKKTDKSHLQEVLSYIVSSIDQIGHLLMPFMPQTAEQIINMFVDGVVQADTNVSLFPKQYYYTSPKRNG